MTTIYNNLQKDTSLGRKRRFSEDEEMADAQPAGSVARLFVEKHQHRLRINDIKRHKSEAKKRSTTAAMLATLDKTKLVNIIHSVLNAHPEVRDDIMTYIPAPTIPSAMTVINDMEERLADSFPYNRHGPGRDDYTFSRVREPLMELIDTVTQYANHFTSAAVFPTTCFSFLDLAASVAHRLPTWDNQDKNLARQELYTNLNAFWIKAVKTTSLKLREGETFSSQTISTWAKNLALHNHITDGAFTEAVHEFTNKLLNAPTTIDRPCDVSVCYHPALETDITRFNPSSPVVGYADVRR
ncbi:Cut8 six-helix bundle-domain-containing protein [Radiomyces spectabilis]|uniref:Cut8 six-helix bundle-domain-containing protein n=1 Tax=Radiomyces spectabilis TaxID=64574 RepID=UPI00221F0670|nr:Cut8 six-helix bundle-domain-containing protein [Radiomyces spectabilis]KAI8388598.1 Cut8 six-helix bundle-domain-containing protein [Radiomyces spectabilis]